MSVPNQKTITIHQSQQVPFLKIGIEELLDAYRNIKTKSSFVMYLYLAANADGYKLELSKQAFENATSYDKSSYYRAFVHLTKLGYIYEDNGHLNFATVPRIGKKGVVQNWEENDAEMEHPIVKTEYEESQKCNASYSEMNTEIDNKYYKENKEIDNSSSSDFSYLKERISPLGEYDGKWLEDEVEGLWSFTTFAQVPQILKNTEFDAKESEYIAYHILDSEARSKYVRTDINGFIKYGGSR